MNTRWRQRATSVRDMNSLFMMMMLTMMTMMMMMNTRWRLRATSVREHRGLGGRPVTHLPMLAHRGNFAPSQDDETKFSGRVSVEKECIICMDAERACLLSPCHHLATCQDCGDMLVQRADCCPVCRTDITDVVHFFRC